MVEIERYTGPREELRTLFELAEDSARELDAYIEAGQVFVAREGGRVIGHLQLTESAPGALEIRNMAVAGSHQGLGIGRELIEAAIACAAGVGSSMLVVATAAADTGNLRFYQRLGFRMRDIERDAFTAAAGYDSIVLGGVELRDRVWLDRPVP